MRSEDPELLAWERFSVYTYGSLGRRPRAQARTGVLSDISSSGSHRGRLNPSHGFTPRSHESASRDAIPLAVPLARMRSPRRHPMVSSRHRTVLIAFLLLGLAAVLRVGVATATPTWFPEQDISDGDVNDTFTSSNGQHFMA